MVKKIKIKDINIKGKYYGFAYPDDNIVEIHGKLGQKRYLNTLIHEILHILYPDQPEAKIRENADTIEHYIWKKKDRRVR